MISLDPSVDWKEYYFRKIISKSERRVLCFPDHLNKIHKTKGFCGDSIAIFCDSLAKSITEYCILGDFEIVNEQNKSRLNIGGVYRINELICDSKSDSPFYESAYSVSQSLKQNKTVFIVNSTLKPWKYSMIFENRHVDLVFRVYLFEKQLGDDYICLESVESPKFKIKTYKYQPKPKQSPNFSSNAYLDDSVNNRSSSNYLLPSLFIDKSKVSVEKEKEGKEKEEEKQNYIANNLSNRCSSSNSSSSSIHQHVTPLPLDNNVLQDIPLTVLAVSDPLSPLYYNNQTKIQPSKLESLKSAYKVKIEEPTTHQKVDYYQMVKYVTKMKKNQKCRIEFDNYGKNICKSLNNPSYYEQIDSKGNVHVFKPVTALLQTCCC